MNNWIYGDHSLSKQFDNYYVVINLIAYNDNISYVLSVTDSEGCTLVLKIYSLVEAVSFAEQVVSVSNDFGEIMKEYEVMYIKGKSRILKREK